MNASTFIAALITMAVVAATWRTLHTVWRTAPGSRPRIWRIALLLLLQSGSALLLYRMLLPPPASTGVDTLVVATARTGVDAATTLTPRERLVALPEVPRVTGAERVPDLATALRRYPATSRLRVLGAGLPARDRDSVSGLHVAFEPTPLPRGLIELSAPPQVQAGADFNVLGRVEGLGGGSAELLDPSGQRVDREPLNADGRFRLLGATRAAGLTEFRLRLRDTRDRLVEDTTIPIDVVTTPSPRVLVLAGGPDPELKFLRRWAIDSGIRLHTQIEAGGGMQLGDPPIAFNASTLKGFDIAIIDERTWDALGDSRRRALADAARDGLGLMVRIAGPMSLQGRRALESLGLHLAPASIATTFVLPAQEGASDFAAARLGPGTSDAPVGNAEVDAGLPALARLPLRIATADARILLRDGEGRAVAAWKPVGRGRVALWLPIDTFQLVLSGRKDLHASLWSNAIATVSRARLEPGTRVPTLAHEGERTAVCALDKNARVVAPDGKATMLIIDPATGASRCAGFWPHSAGWHVLQAGDMRLPFFVRNRGDTPGIRAQQQSEATQRLTLISAHASQPPATVAGSRWPWFFGWLLVSAILWWLERSRLGR